MPIQSQPDSRLRSRPASRLHSLTHSLTHRSNLTRHVPSQRFADTWNHGSLRIFWAQASHPHTTSRGGSTMKTRRYAVIVLRDFTLTVAVSLAAAVACLCTAGPTYAASLGPTGNSATAAAQDIYCPPDGPTIAESTFFDSSQPVTASALATSVTYATAQTSFGVNRAKAYMGGYAPFQAVNSIIAQAGSRWTDQVVITGGTGTGTVRFGYHVSGSFSQYSRGVSFLVSFNVDADDNLLPGWADLEFLHPLAPAPNCLNCPGGFNGSIDHVFWFNADSYG